MIDCARQRGVLIKVREEDIHPVGSDQFPTPAKRPANSRLDTGKLREAFGQKLPPWQMGGKQMLEVYLAEIK